MNENKVIAVEKAAECTNELFHFAKVCYNKGADDAMKGMCIGAGVGVLACVAGVILAVIEEKVSKKETNTEN